MNRQGKPGRIDREFLDLPRGVNTIPFYTVRKALLERVSSAAGQFSGRVLDVGCGLKPYRSIIEANGTVTEYIGMDLEDSEPYSEVSPELIWDGRTIPTGNGSIDCIIATEFLEHIAEPDVVLAEAYRVLRTGGIIFATVPFLWPLHEMPHDEYRYTPVSLRRIFEQAGFGQIEIQGLGGWHLSLAQMIGLWLTFAEIGDWKRRILKRVLYPFYCWLINNDVRPTDFDERSNSMFTGLSVTALK